MAPEQPAATIGYSLVGCTPHQRCVVRTQQLSDKWCVLLDGGGNGPYQPDRVQQWPTREKALVALGSRTSNHRSTP